LGLPSKLCDALSIRSDGTDMVKVNYQLSKILKSYNKLNQIQKKHTQESVIYAKTDTLRNGFGLRIRGVSFLIKQYIILQYFSSKHLCEVKNINPLTLALISYFNKNQFKKL